MIIKFKSQFFLLILLVIQPGLVYPCSAPLPGRFTSPDEIIENSDTILLVKLTKPKGLKIIEVLKGDKDLLYLHLNYYQPSGYLHNYSNDYSGNHFNNHTESNFWTDIEIGRSPFPCCVCGPIHEFKLDEEYLIFPDQMGSMKSAEIIRTKEDKWYKYVKEKTKI